MILRALIAVASVLAGPAFGQTIGVNKLLLQESVKWIEETPNNPEEYIGRVLISDKAGNLTVHYQAIPIPFETVDEPSIKKSTLISAKANAGVSFADFLKLTASTESVYQFQIVNSRTWSAKSRDPKYLEELAKFRNSPTTAPLFASKEVDAVLLCVGVVQRKVWYKVYKKKEMFGSGTYVVNVNGSAYIGSEEYEEVVKYGLLIRPLHGYGIMLPSTIANAAQLESVVDNVPAIQQATTVLKAASRISGF